MAGYVYVASNPSMPGLVKIGRTDVLPEARCAALNNTSVPTPFKVEYSRACKDPVYAERSIHAELEDFRVSHVKEFFKLPVAKAVDTVDNVLDIIIPFRETGVSPDDRVILADVAAIGARIRRERQSRRLSQARLAELAGVRQATISKIESGRFPATRTGVIAKVLRALGGELFAHFPRLGH